MLRMPCRRARICIAGLCVLAGGLILAVSAAALVVHPFIGSFGTAGEGRLGVAVDQATGDVYVVVSGSPSSTGVDAVDKYDSLGEPVAFGASGDPSKPYIDGNQLTGTPNESFSFEEGANANEVAFDDGCYYHEQETGKTMSSAECEALDPSNGDIYVTDALHGVVDIFAPDGTYAGQLTESIEPCSVAVDHIGHVYVGLTNGTVNQYAPVANPVTDGDFTSSLSGLTGEICNLAVDSAGNVYTTTWGGMGGLASRYEPTQFSPPASSPPIAGTVFDPNKVFGVGVDPAADPFTGTSDDVYMSERADVAQYTSGGTLVDTFGRTVLKSQFAQEERQISAAPAVDGSDGDVYVPFRTGELAPPDIVIFGPGVVQPDVTTGTLAVSVGSVSATVAGSVDPDGLDASSRFEYGPSTGYGSEQTAVQAAGAPDPGSSDDGSGGVGCTPLGAGCTPVPVTAELTSLEPDRTYHYRLDGVNVNGVNAGEDQTFTTLAVPPLVDEQSASAVTLTSATLNARINPNNEDTKYRFEYGTSTEYGSSAPASEADAGSGYGDVTVGEPIAGLLPGTTYHFRAIASNASSPVGGSAGPDQTFTTAAATPPVVSTGAASEVSQNSALISGTVDPEGVQTSYEFDIGTDTSYGTRLSGNAGSVSGTETVTVGLGGLSPGTTYHFRLIATNVYGSASGTDVTFTTPDFPTALIAAPVAPALIPAPATAFPTQRSAGPQTRSLSRAQKLADALKECRAQRSKRKRAACESKARERYGKAKRASAHGGTKEGV